MRHVKWQRWLHFHLSYSARIKNDIGNHPISLTRWVNMIFDFTPATVSVSPDADHLFGFPLRRMFPAMRVKITGLDPHQQYYVAMDIIPVDNKRYRYNARSQNAQKWTTTGSHGKTIRNSKIGSENIKPWYKYATAVIFKQPFLFVNAQSNWDPKRFLLL